MGPTRLHGLKQEVIIAVACGADTLASIYARVPSAGRMNLQDMLDDGLLYLEPYKKGFYYRATQLGLLLAGFESHSNIVDTFSPGVLNRHDAYLR